MPVDISNYTPHQLIELHHKKDRYIDQLHSVLAHLNGRLYSARQNRYDLLSYSAAQEQLIEALKLKLFKENKLLCNNPKTIKCKVSIEKKQRPGKEK